MANIQKLLNQAFQLHQAGRIREATILYAKLLPQQKKNFELLYLLGSANLQLGQHELAIKHLQRSLAINPKNSSASSNLGIALKNHNRFDEALASFDKAISINPEYFEAFFNRGNTLQKLKRLDEALASFDKAIAIKPVYADAFNNRGEALLGLSRLDEALASYDKAIAIRPNYAEAFNNRGKVLLDLKRVDESLASCDKAIAIKLNFAEAFNNRGNALRVLKRLDEALVSYDQAIVIKPDYAEAFSNRGNALMDLKRLDEALASYDKALAIKPDCEFLFGIKLHTQMRLSDWDQLSNQLPQLESALAGKRTVTAPFPVFGLTDSPELQLLASRIYADTKYPTRQFHCEFNIRKPDEPIRIGYYSADFHNHATAYLMAELFEAHDFQKYELYGFSFGPDAKDEMRQRISAGLDNFYDVTKLSDREVAKMSRDLGINIAIDLKGFSQDSRTGIFAERCAPIQVNYLGYPGTMATPYIDYIIADKTLIPEDSQVHYTEKVVYLPHSYQVNDSKRKVSDRVFTKQEVGLPENGFVFCCFNNNYKILPATFDGWMRILKKIKGSVLWLLEDNPTASKNLRKEAEIRGVDPGRLVFAKKMTLDDHLARHRMADLFIDTLPCNAHTTASDALWTGLPVLTLIGQSFPGRVAASLLNAMDLPDLITNSQEEYEAKAIELASYPKLLAAINQKLHRNRLSSPLFNGALFARHIEAAFTAMQQRYQAGQKPEHIYVVD